MTQEQSKLNECRTLIFCVQDFLARHSIAGKREGFADARGTLFFEIARLVADKRPGVFHP